jgi:hypothetical protein
MQAETKGKDAGDEYFQAQVIARALAERARRYSRDPLRKVPYGVALAESQGGKRRGLGSLLKPTLALVRSCCVYDPCIPSILDSFDVLPLVWADGEESAFETEQTGSRGDDMEARSETAVNDKSPPCACNSNCGCRSAAARGVPGRALPSQQGACAPADPSASRRKRRV